MKSVRWWEGTRCGFTMVEILAAAVVAAVIAGGSMLAFVAAARMMRVGDTPAVAEAGGYAQQTIERFRNMIACDSPWFLAGTCAPDTAPGGMPTGWVADPLPAPAVGDTESILNFGAQRCYRVTPRDCATTADCFEIEVKVCWSTSPCPC